MSTIQVPVVAGQTVLTTTGEVRVLDATVPAQISFFRWRHPSNSTTESDCLQIDHRVRDLEQRPLLFTSWWDPQFFWDELFTREISATRRGALPLANLEEILLAKDVRLYDDCRTMRAAWIHDTGLDPDRNPVLWSHYSKHLGATFDLYALRKCKGEDQGEFWSQMLLEYHDFFGFYGPQGPWKDRAPDARIWGHEPSDRMFVLLPLGKILWKPQSNVEMRVDAEGRQICHLKFFGDGRIPLMRFQPVDGAS